MKLCAFFFVIIASVFMPLPQIYAQDNCLPTRLVVGEQGFVIPPDPNRLRVEPSTSSEQIGVLQPNIPFEVLETGLCGGGVTWVRVRAGTREGWTAEANATTYFIEPIVRPTATPSATATATPTQVPTATPTAIPTATPTRSLMPLEEEEALERARSFTGTRNTDWTPFEHAFEDGVTMVLVPVGCFIIGSETGDSNEKNGNEVCFDEPFWIDKSEVTQGDFVRLGGVKEETRSFSGENHPVERISWFEARDFCELRGGRLPTEAEWEYVARGVQGLVYPWGNEFIADNVVYRDNSGSQTAIVGSRAGGVSWVGAMDMSGNVWEWVLTLYKPYPYPVNADKTPNDVEWIAAENSTDSRTWRGGSWRSFTDVVRSADRYFSTPGLRNYYGGFRCFRPL